MNLEKGDSRDNNKSSRKVKNKLLVIFFIPITEQKNLLKSCKNTHTHIPSINYCIEWDWVRQNLIENEKKHEEDETIYVFK